MMHTRLALSNNIDLLLKTIFLPSGMGWKLLFYIFVYTDEMYDRL